MVNKRNTSADRRAFEAMSDIANLAKSGKVQPNWLPDGRFWIVMGGAADRRIQLFDPKTRSVSDAVDPAKVRSALAKTIGRAPPYAGLPGEGQQYAADGSVIFSFEGKQYRFDPRSKAVTPVPEPSFMETYLGTDAKSRATPAMMVRPSVFPDNGKVPETLSPDGRRFASLKDGDIYIRSLSNGRYDRLTSDAEPRFGWDVESIRLGLSTSGSMMYLSVNPWSPDSTRIYVTRFDERHDRRHHRIRYLSHFDEMEEVVMPRAGDVLPEAAPYVFDVFSGQRVKLDIDARDCFLLLLGWNEAGDKLYLCRISRNQRKGEVIVADPATGEAKVLFAEESPTFLRIQHEVIGGRSGCTVLPGDRGFIWESERDGWKHFYHYALDGTLVRQLTSGEWPTGEVLGFEPESEALYFSGALDQTRPYDVHIARVLLAGGEVQRLTHDPGMHDAQFAPNFAYFIDTVQSPYVAPESSVVSGLGEVWHHFPKADNSALEAAGWLPPVEYCVKAADGETDLHGLMFKPRDFDAAEKYPVIEYIYGGPQASWVPRNFSPTGASLMGSLNWSLPQLGYIVIIVDSRGTPRRSKAFQDAAYGNWRRVVTADHGAALRNLAKEHPYIDLSRVGMWGFSWGGYFTAANLFDNPDLYRAGVSASPGYDPYGAFIYEPYIGGVPSPATKVAYDDAVLYPDAGKLQGAMMIVAGTIDVGVWQCAVNMSNALIEAGKNHEFVPMPDMPHGYFGEHEAYFVKKLTNHFEHYLLDGGDIIL